MKISIFGVGYVGLVTGACLANLGHDVLCVDIDQKKISDLQHGVINFYEPGLKELVLKNKEKGTLNFTTNIPEAVNFGEAIFNCVGTPGKDDGSANLSYVFSVAENVAKFSQSYNILINKSTVPPGTAQECYNIIKNTNKNSEVEVVSNPEFLAEGKAVYDFTHPDKIVVGAKNKRAFDLVRKIYTGRLRTYIPILETEWETAELIKYANNSFLATKISFINEIANLCDKVGADISVVSQALGMDQRIGPKFLQAGVGYGGSCFPKDVRALAKVGEKCGYETKLLNEVDELNKRQRTILFEKIIGKFKNNLSNKTITIWGLSFKPKTSDIRESPSLDIIEGLLKSGVKVYDPIALEEIRMVFGEKITYCSKIDDSVSESSAIVLLTEWDEFRNVDFSELGKNMKEKIVFDGRNIYEPELVKEEGFEYYGMGQR